MEQPVTTMEQAVTTLMQQVTDIQQRLATMPGPNAMRLPTAVKPPVPETYQGNDTSSSPETWLFQVKQYFDLTGIQDDTQRLLFAAALLRGQASVWWRMRQDRSLGGTPIATFADFEAQLVSQFRRLDPQRYARIQLGKLRQHASVQKYVFAFRELMLDIGTTMTELDKVHYFKSGLKPAIRREIEIRNPTALHECMAMAERTEAIDSACPSDWSSQPPTTVPMDVDAAFTPGRGRSFNRRPPPKRQPDHNWSVTTPGRNTTRRTDQRCFECDGRGHFGRECPTRLKRQQRTPERGNTSASVLTTTRAQEDAGPTLTGEEPELRDFQARP